MRTKINPTKKLKPHGVTFSDEEREELSTFAKEMNISIAFYIRQLTARDKANRIKIMKQKSAQKQHRLISGIKSKPKDISKP